MISINSACNSFLRQQNVCHTYRLVVVKKWSFFRIDQKMKDFNSISILSKALLWALNVHSKEKKLKNFLILRFSSWIKHRDQYRSQYAQLLKGLTLYRKSNYGRKYRIKFIDLEKQSPGRDQTFILQDLARILGKRFLCQILTNERFSCKICRKNAYLAFFEGKTASSLKILKSGKVILEKWKLLDTLFTFNYVARFSVIYRNRE